MKAALAAAKKRGKKLGGRRYDGIDRTASVLNRTMILELRWLEGLGGDCTAKLHAEIDLMHDAYVVGRILSRFAVVPGRHGLAGAGRGDSGTCKVLKRAISGKLFAASAENSPTIAAGTSLAASRLIALI